MTPVNPTLDDLAFRDTPPSPRNPAYPPPSPFCGTRPAFDGYSETSAKSTLALGILQYPRAATPFREARRTPHANSDDVRLTVAVDPSSQARLRSLLDRSACGEPRRRPLRRRHRLQHSVCNACGTVIRPTHSRLYSTRVHHAQALTADTYVQRDVSSFSFRARSPRGSEALRPSAQPRTICCV